MVLLKGRTKKRFKVETIKDVTDDLLPPLLLEHHKTRDWHLTKVDQSNTMQEYMQGFKEGILRAELHEECPPISSGKMTTAMSYYYKGLEAGRYEGWQWAHTVDYVLRKKEKEKAQA